MISLLAHTYCYNSWLIQAQFVPHPPKQALIY